MSERPETLETYARIFEMPRKVEFRRPDGRVEWCMVPAGEACMAAAKALRFMAAASGICEKWDNNDLESYDAMGTIELILDRLDGTPGQRVPDSK